MRPIISAAIVAICSLYASGTDEPRPKHCSADASSEIALPESLHGLSTDGTLLLRVIIRQDGCTEDVRVVKGIEKKIDHAVADVVQSWRFEPALREGKPVKVLVQLSVK